jgi:predicted RND superfamily exporter protein
MIIWLAAVATAAALVVVPSLRIEHAQEKYSPPGDDPVVLSVERFRTLFGARTVLVAALDFGRPIGANDITVIQVVDRELRSLPRVAAVFGLADVQYVTWDLFQPRSLPVVREGPLTDAAFARLRRLVEDTPIYSRGLVSPDWHVAGIAIELERFEGPGGDAREARLALQVDSVLRAVSSNRYETYLTGTPLLNQAFQDSTRSDVQVFGGLSVLFVTLLLLILFRHWRPVVLAGLMATVSLVWTLALQAVTNTPMSASLAMVVPLVLVISVAFSVHYLTHFYHSEERMNTSHRFDEMMKVVFPPSLLTGMTTAAGFLALATSRLESIRETGVFISAGVFLSMVASSALLPALLLVPAVGGRSRTSTVVIPNSVANAMAGIIRRHARLIVGAAAMLSVVASLGAIRLRFDANPLHYFPADTPLRHSSEFVDSTLGGSLPIEIVVTRPREQLGDLVPAVLRVERELREMPEFGFVGSAADFLQMAEAARPNTAPQLYDLTTGSFPSGLWSRLAADRTMGQYVVLDSTDLVLRVAARVTIADSDALRNLMSRVEGALDGVSLGERASVTGLVPLLLRTQEYVVDSQISSLLLAFAFVLVLLFPLVRSWRIGILAVTANAVPLIFIIGIMGWLGISVDITTVMIASIALGIIVDDTIHFLYRFTVCRHDGLGVIAAIERTYEVVGVPLIITTLVLIGGFLALTPSAFQPTSVFGLLAAITIAAAFVADLLFLPALLVVLPTRSRRAAPVKKST